MGDRGNRSRLRASESFLEVKASADVLVKGHAREQVPRTVNRLANSLGIVAAADVIVAGLIDTSDWTASHCPQPAVAHLVQGDFHRRNRDLVVTFEILRTVDPSEEILVVPEVTHGRFKAAEDKPEAFLLESGVQAV